MHKITGFTMLELMIAITIVGILASLAIPSYRDYTIRAKVSEAIIMAAAAKFSISEYYISTGSLPDSETAAIPNISTNYIDSMDYTLSDENGLITVTLSQNIGATANGKKLVLEVSINGDLLSWTCKTATVDGLDKAYLPASCR